MVLPERFINIKIHEYTVMPNHFHAIIEIVGAPLVGAQISMGQMEGGQRQKELPREGQPRGIAPTVGDIVGAFKSISTNEYIRGVKQNDWQRFNKKLWQRNYWEHIIRNENECLKISQYIIDNPAKWQNAELNGGMGNHVMEPQAKYGEEIWMI
jgi:hypothetical protein